jgi:hypothetical protein
MTDKNWYESMQEPPWCYADVAYTREKELDEVYIRRYFCLN